MKTFAAAARLRRARAFHDGLLTGCKKAEAPVFSPAPGTYTGTQYVAMSSSTFGATIVYTTDGSAPCCRTSTGLSTPRRSPSRQTPRCWGDGLRVAARRKPHHQGRLQDQGAGDGGDANVRPPAAGTYVDHTDGQHQHRDRGCDDPLHH